MQYRNYLSIFILSLTTLMYEVLLTRIFSVTMWYHYAFVAVSIAMFGMTVGALLVFFFPSFFKDSKTEEHLAKSSFLFSISIIFSFFTHLSIPFISNNLSLIGIFSIGLNYIVISIPFIFSGIAISLLLSRYKDYVSKLYAFDLVGAGIGCFLLILIINNTDGPNAVLFCSVFAGITSIIFNFGQKNKRFKILVFSTFSLIVLFTIFNTYLSTNQKSLIRLMWVKGEFENKPIYEKWNTYSRIRIIGDPNKPEIPFASGLSSKYKSDTLVYQLKMDIDANAATYLTRFGGNLDSLEYLKYDVSNIAHYLKENAKVCIIGSGGGRDILSALVFKQKEIIAIEINSEIIKAVNSVFADFTGKLDKISNVKFINDEARSFITRTNENFDIIQVSLIDTWAATSAGAFVLAENTIYTKEAWKEFISHLSENGILTFSRWYIKDNSGEMLRLASLASAAFRSLGDQNPENNIIIIRNKLTQNSDSLTDGIGTLLAKRQPFSNYEIEKIHSIAEEMDFEVIYSPNFKTESIFSKIIRNKNNKEVSDLLKVNIDAPSDDNPFFFQMLKFSDILSLKTFKRQDISRNLKAVVVLFALLIIVALLTLICIVIPLIFVRKDFSIKKNLPLIIYFLAIGLGFMLIEISQMQRLIVFLGHPTYSLTVVLFSLLISSGLGSYITGKINLKDKKRRIVVLLFLVLVLLLFALVTPSIIEKFRSEATEVRIIVSIFLLVFIGFFMGSAFPIGIKSIANNSQKIIPWLWGINGAASVFSSVLAVFISIFWGISLAYFIGFLCYIVTIIALNFINEK